MLMARLKVTLTRSPVSQRREQQLTVRSLGLRRVRQSVTIDDNRTNRGMILKVRHLVEVTAEGDD
jgi:large subunit ribosomal protein L30